MRLNEIIKNKEMWKFGFIVFLSFSLTELFVFVLTIPIKVPDIKLIMLYIGVISMVLNLIMLSFLLKLSVLIGWVIPSKIDR